jgi:hypothetical protein
LVILHILAQMGATVLTKVTDDHFFACGIYTGEERQFREKVADVVFSVSQCTMYPCHCCVSGVSSLYLNTPVSGKMLCRYA